MSTELTPVNTYHSTITAPSDGDPATGGSVAVGLQDVGDNAYYNKLRVDAILDSRHGASFEAVNQTVAAGATVPLTLVHRSRAEYTVASGLVTVPNAGTYRVHADASCYVATTAQLHSMGLNAAAVEKSQSVNNPGGGSTATMGVGFTVEITDPVTQKIWAENQTNSSNYAKLFLTIERIA